MDRPTDIENKSFSGTLNCQINLSFHYPRHMQCGGCVYEYVICWCVCERQSNSGGGGSKKSPCVCVCVWCMRWQLMMFYMDRWWQWWSCYISVAAWETHDRWEARFTLGSSNQHVIQEPFEWAKTSCRWPTILRPILRFTVIPLTRWYC